MLVERAARRDTSEQRNVYGRKFLRVKMEVRSKVQGAVLSGR